MKLICLNNVEFTGHESTNNVESTEWFYLFVVVFLHFF